MDCTQIFENVRDAGYKLGLVENDKIVEVLIDIASELELFQSEILYANQEDLDNMEVNNPKYDRLKLTEGRIRVIADDLRSVAKLPSPAGRLLSEFVRPDGLIIRRFTVPFGVIGIIYEARPDVTLNAFSLCFKSGNACILKGGSDALNTNTALVSLIRRVLVKHYVEENIVALLPAGREETRYLLNARNYVDLLIPRGGRDLIDFVRKNAEIPVIETGAGICHTFFEKTGDREKARKIVLNAKTRRVSVCNALDCLVIEKSRVEDLLYIVAPLAEKNVVIYADNISWEHLDGSYPDNLLEHLIRGYLLLEFLLQQLQWHRRMVQTFLLLHRLIPAVQSIEIQMAVRLMAGVLLKYQTVVWKFLRDVLCKHPFPIRKGFLPQLFLHSFQKIRPFFLFREK